MITLLSDLQKGLNYLPKMVSINACSTNIHYLPFSRFPKKGPRKWKPRKTLLDAEVNLSWASITLIMRQRRRFYCSWKKPVHNHKYKYTWIANNYKNDETHVHVDHRWPLKWRDSGPSIVSTASSTHLCERKFVNFYCFWKKWTLASIKLFKPNLWVNSKK